MGGVVRIGTTENPFAPGASPFRAKGLTYAEALLFYDEVLPRGRRTLLETFKGTALGDFLAQSFLVGGWYDALPLIELYRAAGRLRGQPYLEAIRESARWQFPRHINGIYRFFLRLASPSLIIENSPKTARQYYEFVQAEARKLGPRAYASQARGIPELFAPGYMVASEVGLVMALEIAGAKNIRHVWKPREPAGERDGVALVQVGREIHWD